MHRLITILPHQNKASIQCWWLWWRQRQQRLMYLFAHSPFSKKPKNFLVPRKSAQILHNIGRFECCATSIPKPYHSQTFIKIERKSSLISLKLQLWFQMISSLFQDFRIVRESSWKIHGKIASFRGQSAWCTHISWQY